MSIATLLSQHHQVTAVDIIPEKVDMINNRKSPIQDDYIEKYLAEKELNLTATLDAKAAYSDADFVVIAAPTNYDSHTQHFDTSAVEAVIKLVMEYKKCTREIFSSVIKKYTEGRCRMAKKKLLIYAHYYIPDTASTGQILRELAEGMLDKFDITVICVVPSYLGTKERPVKRVPHFEPIGEATCHPIIVHQQLIRRNLEAIFDSKYYLKVGGRHTRGNGVLEAISLGTVCLLSPDDLICPQVLPPEAWVFTVDEAIEKIKYLDSHPDEYRKLLEKERMLVDQFVIKYQSQQHSIIISRRANIPNI